MARRISSKGLPGSRVSRRTLAPSRFGAAGERRRAGMVFAPAWLVALVAGGLVARPVLEACLAAPTGPRRRARHRSP